MGAEVLAVVLVISLLCGALVGNALISGAMLRLPITPGGGRSVKRKERVVSLSDGFRVKEAGTVVVYPRLTLDLAGGIKG